MQPTPNATSTAPEVAPTETDNAAAGKAKGVLAGSIAAGVMGLAVLGL